MTDFEAMSKAMRAASDKIADAENSAKRAEEEAEKSRLAKAEGFLRENVLPLLKQAQSAFEKDGVSVQVEMSITIPQSIGGFGQGVAIWTLSFMCYSSNDGAYMTKKGEKWLFCHDGSSFWVVMVEGRVPMKKFEGGTLPSFIVPVVEAALQSYYEKVRGR